MAEDENKQQMQQKYAELQVMEKHMKEMHEQLQQIAQQKQELNAIIDSLDVFTNLSPNAQAMIPLAQGIYSEGKVDNPQQLIVNVGSDVLVEKSVPEVKKLVEKQISQMDKAKINYTEMLNQLIMNASVLQEELKGLIG